MTVRVAVADDHPVVRAGLATVLSIDAEIEVVGEAADGGTAVDLGVALTPDVVLMDLQMPVLDGVEATRRLAAEAPGVKVLILTTYDSDQSIVRAVEAGAAGYLLKDAPTEHLLDAIKETAAGGTALSPEVAAKLGSRAQAPQASELTARELDVLACVARRHQRLDCRRTGDLRGYGQDPPRSHISEALGRRPHRSGDPCAGTRSHLAVSPGTSRPACCRLTFVF